MGTSLDSKILDVNGRPMKRELLTEEIAGPSVSGVRSIISNHPASGITPQRLASILRGSEQSNARNYFDLAEQMEELDPHYNSVLGTRKRAVAQMPMSVEPADDSNQAKEDAAFIEEWLDRDTLDTEIEDILDAIGKGISYTEIIWDQGDLWLPERLEWRDPSWFEFDRIDGKTPMMLGDGGQLLPLEPAKFICHIHKGKSGLPVRGGYARAIAWGWMFKNYAIKDWVSFLEAYGQPIRVGRYDAGASEGDIRKLMRAVAQIGTDAAAVYPRTMDMEFIDPKAGTAPNELWRSFAEYLDEQTSKLVLGQTSSSDAKSSGIGSGQSDLHGDVRDDIARSDAKKLSATLNRDLVRPMIVLNFPGRTKFPRIKIAKPDPIDVLQMVTAAERLANMGVEIDAEEMRENAGLPAPKSKGAKILRAAAKNTTLNSENDDADNSPESAIEEQSASSTVKSLSPNLLNPLKTEKTATLDQFASSGVEDSKEADAIDNVTSELLEAWDDMFPALIASIADTMNEDIGIEDIQAALASKISELDADNFGELLADAGFSTFIAGELDASNDSIDDGQDDL